jgi:hypothetical protein
VQRYDGPGNNSDIAFSIAVDADGNAYVTGQSAGTGTGYDYTTIKYNPSGDERWVQRYDGPGNGPDQAYSIAVDSDGNAYVTGQSVGIGTGWDYATIKYNSSGNQQWEERYDAPRPPGGITSDRAHSIAVDASGNVYVTGESWGGTSNDYATIKYSSSGVEQWVRRHDGNGSDVARSIAVDANSNVYVTGGSGRCPTRSNYATIKYNSSGDPQWVRRYPTTPATSGSGFSIAVDANGNVYVTGRITGVRYATIKYDPSGREQWVNIYGPGVGGVVAPSIAVDANENAYVTGNARDDYATVKYGEISFASTPAASVTQSVSTTGLVSFDTLDDTTAISINFINLIGSGSVTVNRYDTPPIDTQFSGPAPKNVSSYGWVILQSGLSSINADVRFDLSTPFPTGINNPDSVTVYSRDIGGNSSFQPESTWYDSTTNMLIASVSGFSEFIFGSEVDPLPIQLSSFTATVVSRTDVQLDWTTLTETNNYGFEVQKSAVSPNNYQTIPNSFVPGNGTTIQPHSYSYTDTTASQGVWFYGLKQIDLDGTVHYTEGIQVDVPTGVDEKSLPTVFALDQNYPNPFNPSTQIQFALPRESIVRLEVFNILGERVATLVNETRPVGYYSERFDATGLASGLYLYRMKAGEFVDTKKLLLLK